ncbi:MAG: glycosyltransferase [Sediminibacterium sp.]|nr:glycosyltransferase [Sediminibacterium sp.]
MKIVHLVFDKTDAISRKLANTVDQLATEQIKLGYQVTLWEISTNPNDDLQQRTYKTILFHVKKYQWSVSDEILNAINELSSDAILHFHGGFIPIFFTVAFQLNKKNIPFVYTPHGTFNKKNIEEDGISKKVYFKLFENNLMKWASALHFEGEIETSFIDDVNIVNNPKLVIIPNGLTNESMLPMHKFNELEEPVFAFFGKIELADGGLDILLQGFSDYKQKYNGKGLLWIIGDGPDKKEIYGLATHLGIHNFVTFKGNIFGIRKFELLNKVNALVKPSRFEYDPSIILEAASSYVPAIVSKETNLASYINTYHAGIVLQENNPTNLAKAFLQCSKEIDDGNWEPKRRNAVKMVTEKFQWSTIAQLHINMYEKVLKQPT